MSALRAAAAGLAVRTAVLHDGGCIDAGGATLVEKEDLPAKEAGT